MKPTAEQERHHKKLRELGCIICGREASIHHCFTGGGGRKDHDKVIPLCPHHHQHGTEQEPSIHPWRKRFEELYGTEQELIDKCKRLL
ncbi:MAG: Ref family recombination enhancement nuclease [Candidatus Rickettsiella isopodorum]|nr:Ref family recombination enhancement nuclease [Candidatus Rickettsiella isopodorum]